MSISYQLEDIFINFYKVNRNKNYSKIIIYNLINQYKII